MVLKGEWERLDSETRKWILDNPGCVILPRTISARINDKASVRKECDQHGQMVLSREDLDFIREKVDSTGAPGVTKEYHFFS